MQELNNASMDDIGGRLRQVMSSVFGIDASQLHADASSTTIAEWDSVRHLQLMLAVEEEFGLQFEVDELVSLRSLESIEARLRENGR